LSYLLRLAAFAILLGLLLAGAYAARPAILREVGLDVWEWPDAAQVLGSEEQRGDDLDGRMEGARRRQEVRLRISQDLVAGRMPLDEAVRRTADLGGTAENFRQMLRRTTPGASDEERLYRHVIDWASDLIEDEPGRTAFRTRFGAEVEARFR
jgi:hypothetical protein